MSTLFHTFYPVFVLLGCIGVSTLFVRWIAKEAPPEATLHGYFESSVAALAFSSILFIIAFSIAFADV